MPKYFRDRVWYQTGGDINAADHGGIIARTYRRLMKEGA